MADFDFSMAITAEGGEQAAAEITAVERAVNATSAAEIRLAGSTAELAALERGASAATAKLAGENARLARSAQIAAAAQAEQAAATVAADAALKKAAISSRGLGVGIAQAATAAAPALGQISSQAIGTGAALGRTLSVGRAGAAFFGGPWGVALALGAGALALLGGSADDAGDGLIALQNDATQTAGVIRSVFAGLGNVFDPMANAGAAAFGFLDRQAAMLGRNIRASLQQDFDAIDSFTEALANSSYGQAFGMGKSNLGGRFAAGVARSNPGPLDVQNANLLRLAQELQGDLTDSKAGFVGFKSGAAPRARAARKGRAGAKGPDLGEFSDDTADRIKDITAQFQNLATQQVSVARATRQIDDLISDLQKKKPPNFEKLIKDAQAAKLIIADGINKPFRDMIAEQREQVDQNGYLLRGLSTQAEVRREILALEKQMGPLSKEQAAQVQLGVEALREQQRELDILREKQQSYLTALDDMRGAVRAVFTDGAKGIADLPKRLLNGFTNLQADVLTEKLFGDVFRELQDKITGQDIVKGAAREFASTVRAAKPPINDLATSATGAANALDKLTAAAGGGAPVGAASVLNPGGTLGVGDNKGGLSKAGINSTTGPLPDGADIVVNAITKDLGNKVKELRGITNSPTAFYQDSIGKVSSKIFGEAAGKKIGEIGGKALGGFVTGTLVDSFLKPLGNALGFKTSKLGGQIGGTIGSFLPIPFGKEIGAVVGSIIGGLFKKTKTGSATIGNVNGVAGVTGTSGNSGGQIRVAEGLAGAVGDALGQIADTLGGQIGNFGVSIGKRDKKFVVDTSGRGRTKGSGVQKFKTEEEAQAAALAAAIGQGAIAGVSAAVQRALSSSSDVNKAVKEALKVQEVEDLISGMGGTLERQFRAFEAQARERVRIAQQYGFDVIKIEKINAEQRLALVDELLTSRIGALQDLLKDFTTGDLFEGDAKARRAALLGEITKTRAQVDAGVAGAPNTLADLLRQLATSSRDAFGTAGPEFAADRQTAIDNATAVIAAERKRVEDAQAAVATTNAALATGNTLTNETNDLLAQNNALLATIAASFGFAGVVAGVGNLELTRRNPVLPV